MQFFRISNATLQPLYLTEWGGLFLQWIAAVRAGWGGGGNLLFAFRACVDCHKDTSI